MKIEQCPLFSFCNCKTAMCRVILPDESCYWYRYFKQLIKENQEMKINNQKYEKYLEDLDRAVENGDLTEEEARLDYLLYGDEDGKS